ncbi:hypothetical protein SELMODRAFT_406923 [Selaginella moellendorffii]|uniref:Uncharacterized protein n=1 Tax=Selaginella moellendorffii TaxID=88036 RepID=D8R3D0_SELML|nr:hypothetical protein SELMODRAFT_406923 [Selaginella moellendorffii]
MKVCMMGRNAYLSVVSTVVRRLDLRLCRVWDQACNAAEVDMSIARVEYYRGPITYADLRSGVDSLDEKTHRDLVKAVLAKVKRDVKRQMQMPKFSNSLAKLIRRSPWKPGLTPSNVFSKSTPGAREFKERMQERMCSKLLQERPGEMDFSANSCYEPDVYNQLVEWIEGAKEYHREIEIKGYTGCCVNLFSSAESLRQGSFLPERTCHLPTAATAGKEISKKRMEDEKTWVWNCVIRDYGMLGRVECAREAFLQCPARNFLSWKLLADAYAHKGHYGKVLEIEDKIPAVMYQLAPPPPSPASIFDAVSLYQKGKRWAAWELLQVFCHEGNGRKILFSALGKYKTVSMLLVFTSLLTYGDAQLFKLIRTMIEGSSLTEESLIHLACCQGKKEVKRLEDYYHGLHLSKTRGVPVTRVEAPPAAKEPVTQGVAVTQGVPMEPATQGVPMEARAARERLEALYIKASFCVFGEDMQLKLKALKALRAMRIAGAHCGDLLLEQGNSPADNYAKTLAIHAISEAEQLMALGDVPKECRPFVNALKSVLAKLRDDVVIR